MSQHNEQNETESRNSLNSDGNKVETNQTVKKKKVERVTIDQIEQDRKEYLARQQVRHHHSHRHSSSGSTSGERHHGSSSSTSGEHHHHGSSSSTSGEHHHHGSSSSTSGEHHHHGSSSSSGGGHSHSSHHHHHHHHFNGNPFDLTNYRKHHPEKEEDENTDDDEEEEIIEEEKPKKEKKIKKPLTKEQKKKRRKRFIVWGIVIFILFAIFMGFYIGKLKLDDSNPANRLQIPSGVGEVEQNEDGSIIWYNGKKYTYNDKVFCVLFIGWENYRSEGEGIGYNGQADADYLCVLNTENTSVTIVPINRDSWVDVDVYSQSNQLVRTEKMQLSLAYAYGNGGESSCENVKQSVSRLLCNISIPMYASLSAEGIGAVNDVVGGVEVPEYDRETNKKTGNMITLYGENAVSYLKSRDTEKVGSVSDRMTRQKDYIKAFAKKMISKTKEDISSPIIVYNTVSKYITTDIDITEIAYLATKYFTTDLSINYVSIDGEYTVVDEHDVFIPDSVSAFETVLDLFYVTVE